MQIATGQTIVIRTRAQPWGAAVALPTAIAFLLGGIVALFIPLLPARVGPFVEPPSSLLGLAFLAMAALLFLVGIAELAHYLRPAPEVVIDDDGIALHGLLGERRVAWRQVQAASISGDLLSLKVLQTGRLNPFDVRVHFSRLDCTPGEIVAAIRSHRPDLLAP